MTVARMASGSCILSHGAQPVRKPPFGSVSESSSAPFSSTTALIVVVPISSPSVFILIPQQLVEPGSRRSMMSFWIAGLRSRKLTKVPWIRMIYTPLGAYFFGSASTFRSVSAVVTFT